MSINDYDNWNKTVKHDKNKDSNDGNKSHHNHENDNIENASSISDGNINDLEGDYHVEYGYVNDANATTAPTANVVRTKTTKSRWRRLQCPEWQGKERSVTTTTNNYNDDVEEDLTIDYGHANCAIKDYTSTTALVTTRECYQRQKG